MARATCKELPGALGWLCARRSALAVLLLGVTLSAFLYALAAREERRGLEEKFQHHSKDMAFALSSVMQGYVREMGAVARLYYASDDVTRNDFRTFVTPFLARDHGVEAVGWVPRVTDEQRAAYEASMRADGFAGFQITQLGPNGAPVRRDDAGEYFPMTYLEPFKGNGSVMGFDLSSNPVRDQTLEQARASGQPEASGRVRLVQQEANSGFLVLYPVYENGAPTDTTSERRRNLKGFVDFAFRLDNVVQATFNEMRPLSINVLLRDGSAPAGEGYLAYYSGSTEDDDRNRFGPHRRCWGTADVPLGPDRGGQALGADADADAGLHGPGPQPLPGRSSCPQPGAERRSGRRSPAAGERV